MRGRTIGAALGLFALAAVWGACAQQRAEPLRSGLSDGVALPAEALKPAERGRAATPLTSVDGRREGGALILADGAGRRLLLVADEDAAAVRVVDAATHQQLATAPLSGRPGQLVVGADGRAYVALRDAQEVLALELLLEPTGEPAAETATTKVSVNNVHETTAGGALTLREAGRFATAAEPIGLAMSPDGDTLLVASGWGHQLQGLSLRKGETKFSVDLPREPRAVAVSPDGAVAFVSHAVGSAVSRVTLRDTPNGSSALTVGGTDQQLVALRVNKRPITPLFAGGTDQQIITQISRGGCFGGRCGFSRRRVAGALIKRHVAQGFALASFQGDAIAPLVVARTGVEAQPVGGYGTSESFAAHQAALATVYGDIDEVMVRTDSQMYAASVPQSSSGANLGRDGCLLPRAIAVDERRAMALVSCVGNDQLIAYRINGDSLMRATLGRWRLPAGPVGVAIDSNAGQAHIWSQYACQLSSVTLPAPNKAARLFPFFDGPPKFQLARQITSLPAIQPAEGGPTLLSAAAKRGRELFHGAGDARISADGRACASCHPDGREDGLTWPSPQGKSQTPMLAGRMGADTAPYGWNGESDSVAEHVQHTFKRLGGRGLKGDELTALMAYIQEMPAPPRQQAAGLDVDLVARGKALFEQDAVGCAVCHKQGDGSDGATHNVGSGRDLDTPSLRFISGTGPYFHDGRYATLMDVLRETKGKMGWGTDLSEGDLSALHAYLLTL